MTDDLWLKQQAETTFVWGYGDPFPKQVVCIVYEENQIGEKRFVESKTFNLVDVEEVK